MSRLVLRSVTVLSFLAMVVAASSSLEGCKKAKSKGGGASGAAAQSAGQKVGGTAASDTAMATNDGADSDGVTCDSSTEGLGWCSSDTLLVFCTGGSFYTLDCSAIGGDFCGEDGTTIDCYASSDF